MIYNLKNKLEVRQYSERSKKLIEKEARVELKEKRARRTLPQNSYLHLIIDYFATQVGYTSREAKQYFVRINHDIFEYEKMGETFYRSTSELNTMEMSKLIDRIIHFASEECGIYLPDPKDLEGIDQASNTVETHQKYL